ncbi:mannonate dehydratase [Roseisolibacter agri]|uniref:mannonate dehydratase n=1 Tax=Roseisolibacter agri TaxID=2014610 RepID=A0AA37QDB1_9BACT|nr:mannonate dehydratase [Roseisolibacter agri]GLC23648.1 mannonate dehydratase [Roseisolibacter agri]
MKLGLGLYRSLLTPDNFAFAKQAGVTHLIVHLVDYFKGATPNLTSGPPTLGWGVTQNQDRPWTYEELVAIKKEIEGAGLTWEAIENFDPSHWHDVLLDGPKKVQQMENLKRTIQAIGRAGIPIMGYNFSIAGVWGWTKGPYGRGGAKALVYDESKIDKATPLPNGMVWNMVYDPDAPEGVVAPISSDEIWQRLEWFLQQILPVAEENGVRMALHPDDPPTDALRGGARLVNTPGKYQRMLDLVPSSSSALEYCLGSLQEMAEGDVYEATEHYGRLGKIAYVHFRNVRGKVPHYQEVFVDEGDLDMIRVLSILRDVQFDGVIIPDHTPEMTCGAPWHAGMAFALGYIKAAMQAVDRYDAGRVVAAAAR